MSTDLTDRIGALAREWEADAPPIALEEVVGHTVPNYLDPDGAPFVTVVTTAGRRPRTAFLFAASLATAAAIVGALVFAGRNGREINDLGPAPVASDVPSSSAQTTAAVATTAAPSITTQTPSITTLPPTTDDISAGLAAIAAARNTALASVQSFSGTSTVRRGSAQADGSMIDSTTVYDVTLSSDGSLWAVGVAPPAMTWASFDASTGTARNTYTGPDGVTHHQEIVGWADNSTPVGILFGQDPSMPLVGLGAATIEETVHDGRSAWQITRVEDLAEFTESGGVQTQVWTIDQATGLIVGKSSTEVRDDLIVQLEETSLTGLQLDVAMPAEFPGSFPDGAAVERSGDATGFSTLTPVEAAMEFGEGFFIPVDQSDSARISLTRGQNFFGDDQPMGEYLMVTITFQHGFVEDVITLQKFLPPQGPTPEGWLQIGDALCMSQDGVTCPGPTGSVITAGALAGAPSEIIQDIGGTITATVGAVQIALSASTPEAALELANSLTTVEF